MTLILEGKTCFLLNFEWSTLCMDPGTCIAAATALDGKKADKILAWVADRFLALSTSKLPPIRRPHPTPALRRLAACHRKKRAQIHAHQFIRL